MRAAIVCLLVAAGCVRSESVLCDDGYVCPADTTCKVYARFGSADPLHLCVSDQQIADCDGKTDGQACGSASGSQCYNGACLAAGCGNSIPDPGEVCDDGNHVAGDGCSPDCKSDEQCGNGYVDSDLGEQCDDGNTLARDGCDSRCAIEAAMWTQEYPSPQRLSGAHLAYDSARDVVVMFGGNDGSATPSELWEFDGRVWQLRSIAGPHGRNYPALAYDPKRQRTVLYGDTLTHDTWEWDGEAWTELTVVTDPGPRAKAAMTWDPQLGKIVLFGGTVTSSVWFTDTWTWDGTTWAQIPSASPALSQPALAYDFARDVLVLTGLDATNARVVEELGADESWHAVPSAGQSPGAGVGTLAWDPVAGAVMLSNNVKTGWASWNGSQWTSIAPAVTFGGEAPLATLGRHDAVVAWNASQFYRRIDTTDAWVVDRVLGTYNADAAGGAAVTYDMIRRRAVWIGSFSSPTDVWSYDGGWESYPAAPASFEDASAAYDPVRDRIVVFGGVLTGGDTWTVDAATLTDWQLESPPTSPSARKDSALAFDVARGNAVLFGGIETGTNAALGDTWTWDGATWTRETGPAPSARVTTLAYDPLRQRTVMFGTVALGGVPLMADTWEWDGSAWMEIATPEAPEPQTSSIAWDAGSRRVILVGGSSLPDAWAYDGATWREIVQANPFTNIPEAGVLVPDPSGAGVVLLQGELTLNQPVIWRLRYEGPHEETCVAGDDNDGDGAAGCADADCAFACTPIPEITCGDGTCDARVESALTCPVDCPVTPACGDFACTGAAEPTTCPGDCH